MPEITLEKAKKRGYLLVMADGQPAFETTRAMLESFGVKSAMLLSDEKYNELYAACKLAKARKKAVTLLSAQGMSKRGLQKKLGNDAHAAQVAGEMERAGYINDEEYAAARADLLVNRRLHSPRKALYELVSEGIPREIAHKAIKLLEYNTEENIRRLVEGRLRSRLSGPGGAEKVARSLVRAGYEPQQIKAVLQCTEDIDCIDCEDEESWESE